MTHEQIGLTPKASGAETPKFIPGIYSDFWHDVNRSELITPYSDPAVGRLYDLASIPETEPDYDLYGFMRDFVVSQDPVIRKLYGDANRLAGLQYYMDKKTLEVGEHMVPLTLGTWSADVRFAPDEEAKRPDGVRKLNEDAILARPFGPARVLVAVFDGASSQKPVTGLEPRKLKGSWYISHLISMGFPLTQEHLELEQNPKADAKEVMIAMNRWAKQELSRVPGVNPNDVLTLPGMAATLALVDFRDRHISIAHVADTYAQAVYKDRVTPLTNNLNSRFDAQTQKRVSWLAHKLGKTPKEVAELQHPLILRYLKNSFREKINTPQGTGIVNGQDALETTPGLLQAIDLEITDDLLTLEMASDGWHMAWTGRKDLDKDTAALEMAAAMHSPYFRPSHPAYQSLERLNMDPDHWAIERLSHDDASMLSVGLQGRASEQDSPIRKAGRELLKQDYGQILSRYK